MHEQTAADGALHRAAVLGRRVRSQTQVRVVGPSVMGWPVTATVSRSTVSAQIGHATIEAGSEVPSRSLEQIAEGIAEPPEHSLLGYLDLGPRSSVSENP